MDSIPERYAGVVSSAGSPRGWRGWPVQRWRAACTALLLVAGPLGAAPLYVRAGATGTADGSSWANAYTDLQAAIEAAAAVASAAAPVDIWVAAGTYRPTSWPNGGGDAERAKHFALRNHVALYGGFPASGDPTLADRDPAANLSLLSGDIGVAGDASDNCYHVFHHTGALNGSAAIHGFTLSGGNANGAGWPHDVGGGMLDRLDCSPTLTDCRFVGNSAQSNGGGMLNLNGSSPTLTRCLFTGNSSQNYGAGMYNQNYSSPTLTRCTFSGNTARQLGGGMHNLDTSSPTLTDCVFAGNSVSLNSGGGMAIGPSSAPTLTNCLFVGNSANNEGGGLFAWSSTPTLTNCTFAGNSARSEGGGVASNGASLSLANCILWGNSGGTGDEAWSGFGGTLQITYSCVAGGYAGEGNVAAAPAFADAGLPAGADGIYGTADDGLRLLPGSPCIDAANGAVAPAVDRLGVARYDDLGTANTGVGTPPYADMGAYEFPTNSPRDQTITFDPLPSRTLGEAPFALSASATSGLPVSFASSDHAVATVAGETVTLRGAGTCVITASQAGDPAWRAAPPVAQNLVVDLPVFTVTFDTGEHGTRCGGGELLQRVPYGQAAVAPELELEMAWLFTGWSADIAVVTRDLTVTALYRAALFVEPNAPHGHFLATAGGSDAVGGQAIWDFTGSYATSLARAKDVTTDPLTLQLVHDSQGRVTGTGAYTFAAAPPLPLVVKGAVQGLGGVVTMKLSAAGRQGTSALKVVLTLTLEPDRSRLAGLAVVKGNSGATAVAFTSAVLLSLPEPMDGAWSLEFAGLATSARDKVTGAAFLLLANGVGYPLVVRGALVGETAVLSLAGNGLGAAAKGIQMRATIRPLEGEQAVLQKLSARLYGQSLIW